MKIPSRLYRGVLYFLWTVKLTSTGRYLVGTGIFSGILSMSTLDVPVYIVFCFLFALGLVALVVNACFRPRCRLVTTFPERVVAGESFRAEVVVTNIGHLPAFDVGFGFVDRMSYLREVRDGSAVRHIARGASFTHSMELLPLRRGSYVLPPLRVFSTFPFDIVRAGASSRPASSLLVLPSFHPVTSIDVPVSARHQPGGIALTSHVGESPEYIGNRDYFPGDPIRRLDVRAWARLAKPVVREYQEEYYCRLALVLDTHVPSGSKADPEGYAELEAAISLAASVADALSRGEYIIDIFAAGPELYVFRAGRNVAQLDTVLDILACIDAVHTNPFDTLGPALAEELGNISTAIFVFLQWDDSRRAFVRLAEEAGCETKVFLVSKHPPEDDLVFGEAGLVTHYTPELIRSGQIDVL